MARIRLSGLMSFLPALALWACGADPVQVVVVPAAASVAAGARQQFLAQVANAQNPAVTWSVLEGAAGGSIDSTGLYTAPAEAGTAHVVATSVQDPARTGVATVTIVRDGGGTVTVSVSPAAVELVPGARQTFQATVSGATDTSVLWSVKEAGGGTIGSDGGYLAPATPGTFHVVALSVADPAARGEAVVTVVAAPVVTVQVSPATATLEIGATTTFAAAVEGGTDTAVVWSVREEGGGTVDAEGLYTAPGVPGEYHVVATSHAATDVSDEAVVTVTAPTVTGVVVNPKTASVEAGATRQFSATVSGTIHTGVVWSVLEGAAGGAVGAGGLYAAPQTAGTYHVVATSQADPTKSDTATVEVWKSSPSPVLVSPATALLRTGETRQFSATVQIVGDRSVDWSVREGSAGGTITSDGLYTAPGTPGTYHVVATSRADGSLKGEAEVTVVAGPVIGLSVVPAVAEVALGGSQRFTAAVTGTTDTRVSWAVREADCGTVDAAGVYQAPTGIRTCHVLATSLADARQTAEALVYVMANAQVRVFVSPDQASVRTGGTQQYSAVVTNAADVSVQWSVREGAAGGTITAGGLYTAPQTPGTYHVVATSVASPAASAEVWVAVTEPAAIDVTPAGARTGPGTSVQFSAKARGSVPSGATIAWSVREGAAGGTIDASGLYTAPAATGAYHVVASVADASTDVLVTVAADAGDVQVSPGTASLSSGATLQFTATVLRSYHQEVVWSVVESDGGGISPTGLYTAPPTPGTYHVRAVNAHDPTRSAQATIAVVVASIAGTVAGTAGTGRVWIEVRELGGSPVAGTSIAGPGPFVVRGVRIPGEYEIVAWRAPAGLAGRTAAAPSAVVAVSVTGDTTGLLLTLSQPAPATPPAVGGLEIFPQAGGLLVVWRPSVDANDLEAADAYRVWWSTAPAPGPGNAAGSRLVPAALDGLTSIQGLADGAWYVAVAPVRTGAAPEEGPRRDAGPVTVGPPAGGVRVSGRVHGPAANSGGPLTVLLYGAQAGYSAHYPQASFPRTWQIDGVPAGAYRLVLLAGDGVAGGTARLPEPAPGFTVVHVGTSPLLLADATLPEDGYLTVTRADEVDGTSEVRSLAITVASGLRTPLKATLTASPAVTLPLDLPFLGERSRAFGTSLFLSPVAVAAAGAPAAVTVDWSDGTQSQFTTQLGPAAGMPPPTLVAPAGSTSNRQPLFQWTIASPPAGGQHLELTLEEPAAGSTVWRVKLIPGSAGSIAYNADGRAKRAELQAGHAYRWGLALVATDGNRVLAWQSFTVN